MKNIVTIPEIKNYLQENQEIFDYNYTASLGVNFILIRYKVKTKKVNYNLVMEEIKQLLSHHKVKYNEIFCKASEGELITLVIK